MFDARMGPRGSPKRYFGVALTMHKYNCRLMQYKLMSSKISDYHFGTLKPELVETGQVDSGLWVEPESLSCSVKAVLG